MKNNNELAIRLPAEWEPQDAIILAWPNSNTDWQPFLEDIQHTFLSIIKQITRYEFVVILLPDEAMFVEFRQQLNLNNINQEKIIPVFADYNDTWLRDSGPITVTENDRLKLLDFRFNGWGNKFNHQSDDKICEKLFSHAFFKDNSSLKIDIVLEGGSIDSDGNGVILTTRQCLLNKNRNPMLTQQDYENLFSKQMGVKKVHWLEHGSIIGDDTDGHIDMLARFCPNNKIVHCACHDKKDPHFLPFKNLTDELLALRDLNNRTYELIELPIPKAIFDQDNDRLPASYCNFLILNKAVLVPIYNDEMDQIACDRLADIFSDREIIPIDASTIIKQGGSLHCLTMQLPAGCLSIQNEI